MYNSLSEKVIGAAIEVHRKIGPGLLESAYRECLTREFELRNIQFEREVAVPLSIRIFTSSVDTGWIS